MNVCCSGVAAAKIGIKLAVAAVPDCVVERQLPWQRLLLVLIFPQMLRVYNFASPFRVLCVVLQPQDRTAAHASAPTATAADFASLWGGAGAAT